MSDLVGAVRQLAGFHVKSPARIVWTPRGGYVVCPDGTGDGDRNRFVISRSQLGTLMWKNGFRREELTDPHVAGQLAGLVASCQPLGHEGDGERP